MPYAIDFLNPAPDFERDRITEFYFTHVVDRMARLVIDRAHRRQPDLSLAALGRNAGNWRTPPDLPARRGKERAGAPRRHERFGSGFHPRPGRLNRRRRSGILCCGPMSSCPLLSPNNGNRACAPSASRSAIASIARSSSLFRHVLEDERACGTVAETIAALGERVVEAALARSALLSAVSAQSRRGTPRAHQSALQASQHGFAPRLLFCCRIRCSSPNTTRNLPPGWAMRKLSPNIFSRFR